MGFSSLSGIGPSPRHGGGEARRDGANNRLSAIVDHHALNPDNLRPLPAAPVYGFGHVHHRARQVRGLPSQPVGGVARLLGQHRPARALHRGVMHRHRLRRHHALNLIARIEAAHRGERRVDKIAPAFFGVASLSVV
jgi:hypothetical protein